MVKRVVSEEQRLFESMQPDLVRRDPGRYAVVCSDRLLGVFATVDDALSASSRAFDAGELPEGAPVLINEIAERSRGAVSGAPAQIGSAGSAGSVVPRSWRAVAC